MTPRRFVGVYRSDQRTAGREVVLSVSEPNGVSLIRSVKPVGFVVRR